MSKISNKINYSNVKIAVIYTKWNESITDKLLSGAKEYLIKQGVQEDNISEIKIPGAFEMPLACKITAESNRFDGIIALGCVIRGETAHFEYVAGEAARGVTDVMLHTGIPIGFGVLTTENVEQAENRAGGNKGNKGHEAADAVLEILNIKEQIK